jgi:hypothetical protein
VNYKVDVLIPVVEEKLPNGAHAWQEVAALYQARSGESLLRDHDEIKRHWTDKCCNKFKKPTGSPGDPKRDMILRCQRIHQRILKKSASSIMDADSEGDEGLELSEDSDSGEEGGVMRTMWMVDWWMALLLRVLLCWRMNRWWWRN